MLLAIGKDAILSTYFYANKDKCLTQDIFIAYMKYAWNRLVWSPEYEERKNGVFYTFLPMKTEFNQETRKKQAYQFLCQYARTNIRYSIFDGKIQLPECFVNNWEYGSSITEQRALKILIECAGDFTKTLGYQKILEDNNIDDSRYDDTLDQSEISIRRFGLDPSIYIRNAERAHKESLQLDKRDSDYIAMGKETPETCQRQIMYRRAQYARTFLPSEEQ